MPGACQSRDLLRAAARANPHLQHQISSHPLVGWLLVLFVRHVRTPGTKRGADKERTRRCAPCSGLLRVVQFFAVGNRRRASLRKNPAFSLIYTVRSSTFVRMKKCLHYGREWHASARSAARRMRRRSSARGILRSVRRRRPRSYKKAGSPSVRSRSNCGAFSAVSMPKRACAFPLRGLTTRRSRSEHFHIHGRRG